MTAALLLAAAVAGADPGSITVDGGHYPDRMDSRTVLACGRHEVVVALTSRLHSPSSVSASVDGRALTESPAVVKARRALEQIVRPFLGNVVCGDDSVSIVIRGVATGAGEVFVSLSLPLKR